MTSTRTEYLWPSSDGVARFKTVRLEKDDGTKTFSQAHRENAESEWINKAPPVRPLWRLDELDWLPDNSAVLVVEGEKTAEAAQLLFGERLFVTTWSGGSNAVKKTDWEPLKRHRVAILPDVDQKNFAKDHPQAGTVMPWMMQPGMKAALLIATLTGGALVDLTDAFIEAASWVCDGWDLADAMPDGFTLQDIASFIRKALDNVAGTPARASEDHAAGVADNAPVGGEAHPADSMNGHVVENVPPHGTDLLPADARWQSLPHWRGGPLMSSTGAIKSCFENARRLLVHCPDKFKLRFDLFGNRPCYGDVPLEDEHILVIAGWVQSQGVGASTATIGEAVIAASLERRFHPVTDYLDGLTWDGVERLDTWLVAHAGVEDTELHRAMSRKWLIQAIARIREPGCQADAMMILEGAQGLKKSSLLRALFGKKWFSDHLPDLSNKDSLLQLLGMWCIEVAELATLGRSDANKIKQFLTSPVDRYRAPYGKIAKDYPRSCVFAGTVNPGAAGYLKDPTGGRRFWPMACNGKINTGAVAAIRDQLWAEADAYYGSGEPWWLHEEHLEVAVVDVQDARREDDVWEERIGNFLIGKTNVTASEVLEHGLGLYKAGEWTTADHSRVGRILTSLRWTRRQVRTGDKRLWKYFAPELSAHERNVINEAARQRRAQGELLSPSNSGDTIDSGDTIL